jgi:hypothetical protein
MLYHEVNAKTRLRDRDGMRHAEPALQVTLESRYVIALRHRSRQEGLQRNEVISRGGIKTKSGPWAEHDSLLLDRRRTSV